MTKKRSPKAKAATEKDRQIEELTNRFRAEVHRALTRNVGNMLTEELGTGLYAKINAPLESLVAELKNVIAD